MIELAQGIAFAAEAFKDIGLMRQRLGIKSLNRNCLPVLVIRGAIDNTHHAAAEHVFFKVVDLKPIGNDEFFHRLT